MRMILIGDSWSFLADGTTSRVVMICHFLNDLQMEVNGQASQINPVMLECVLENSVILQHPTVE